MESIFKIESSTCMTCTNMTLKNLGTLQGVFGAEVDRGNAQIIVNHTDEVTRNMILVKLISLGFEVLITDIEPDEPSIWGCAL